MYSDFKSIKEFFHKDKLDQHFDKRYEFSKYQLDPNQDLDSLFDAREWQIDTLQLVEEDLFRVKSKLDDFNLSNWSYLTNKYTLLDKDDCYASFVDYEKKGDLLDSYQKKPELFTRAWLKLYEILVKFNIKDHLNDCLAKQDNQINCLFLCEAPGKLFFDLIYIIYKLINLYIFTIYLQVHLLHHLIII